MVAQHGLYPRLHKWLSSYIPVALGLMCLFYSQLAAQSLELMPGTEGIFADVQFLKPLRKKAFDWTVFSRTRALVDYDGNANIFSAAYLNYTTKVGLGGSVVGKVSSSSGGGADVGIHYFKSTKTITLFILVSTGINNKKEASWFSIFRYRPPLNEKWKLYTSLELFTLLNTEDHLASVQRVRVGLDREKWQFGLAANLTEAGPSFDSTINPGVFIRKEF